jgi:hypothetical protein
MVKSKLRERQLPQRKTKMKTTQAVVYILINLGQPKLLKIGHTTDTENEGRRESIDANCKIATDELWRRGKLLQRDAKRLEQLVQAELNHFNRRFKCDGCIH